MSLRQHLVVTCGGWFSFLLLTAALRTSFGPAAATSGELAIWAFLFTVPPAIVMLRFRGAPPPLISEVIYRTEIRRRMNEIPAGADSDGR